MAAKTANSLEKALRTCFPSGWIWETARNLGLVRRRRKVDIAAFFWTLVLGFGTGVRRSLTELRRDYEAATGVKLVPSSFYDRFTPLLTRLLKEAVAHACKTVAEPIEALSGKLGAFIDLVVADSTVLRLHDLLAEAFRACRTNNTKAAMKLHLVMSVFGMGPLKVRLAGERTNDGKFLLVGKWVCGRLLLFDMGYFSYQLFDRIDRNQGFFITRLKDNANPKVVEVHGTGPGRRRPLVGQRLRTVIGELKRKILDVQVEVVVKRRKYRGVRNSDVRTFRLVGILNEETKRYHLYVTNVPVEKLSAEDVALTYAARWQVELLFKELKSHYRLDDLPSASKHIVEALVYAAILTLIASRAVLMAMRSLSRASAGRTPERRWAATFQSVVPRILALLCVQSGARRHWHEIQNYLLHEFIDPNVSRARNLNVCRS